MLCDNTLPNWKLDDSVDKNMACPADVVIFWAEDARGALVVVNFLASAAVWWSVASMPKVLLLLLDLAAGRIQLGHYDSAL